MGFVVKAVKSVGKFIGKVVGKVAKVVGGVFGFTVGGGGKKAKAANTLNKSLEPETARKIVFGRTAAPLDVRYWEVYGDKNKLFDEVIAVAGHRISGFRELYLEDKLAVAADGTIQPEFVGVLSRAIKLGDPGQTALAVGSGTQWNASSTFPHSAHMVLKWNPDEKKLPNGIPGRYTQVIDGAFVYDPRRDSTVPGGSGTHRINDRNTWEYATLDPNSQPIGRNNALQALAYLLGFIVPTVDATGAVTGEMLLCGRGVFPEDINLQTFITGANACETAGYYTDLVLSTDDDHTTNEEKITCDGLIARLIDPGGLWSYYANVDDTANIAVELTDADVIGGTVNWNEFRGMSDQYNQVGGKFVNPSATTLFQAFPYPLVRDATYETNLGVKRRRTKDFEQVLDSTLAQRLARLLLNEGQYQGEHSANWNYRAVKAQAWSVVRYQSDRFGWTKLFRVWRHDISTDGGVSMLLKEIHASIWTAGTVVTPPAPGVGIKYDPRQEIPATGLIVGNESLTAADGTKRDHVRISWDAPPENVRRTEVRYKLNGTTFWETAGPIKRGQNSVLSGVVLPGSAYIAEIRHISIHEIEGPWLASAVFTTGNTNNVTLTSVNAAGETADVATLKDKTSGVAPSRTNILTNLGISDGFRGQKALATRDTIASFHIDLDAVVASKLNFGETTNFNRDPHYADPSFWGLSSQGGITSGFTTDATITAALNTTKAARFLSNGGSNSGTTTVFPVIIPRKVPVRGGETFFVEIPWRRVGALTARVWLQASQTLRDGTRVFSPQLTIHPDTTATDTQQGVVRGRMKLDAKAVDVQFALQTFVGAGVTPTADFQVGAILIQRMSALGQAIFREDFSTVLTDALAVTNLGISDGFRGQKFLATQDFVNYDDRIAGLPAGLAPANLRTNADGQRYVAATSVAWSTTDPASVESLRPAERNANITETHISDGFRGQKALATLDFADYDTRISNLPAGLAPANLRVNADGQRYVAATSVAWSTTDPLSVESLRPAERNANITETHISDGFKGQKALATLDSIAFDDTLRLTARPYGLQAWDVNGRLYAERMRYNVSGVTIDALEPQEGGANKTETRISDGFKGQQWGATATADQAENARVRIGANALVNSGVQRGTNWVSGVNAPPGWIIADAPTAGGRNGPDANWYGVRNVLWWHKAGLHDDNIIIGNDAIHANGNEPHLTAAQKTQLYMLPVNSGDRIFAAAKVNVHRGKARLKINLYDAAGVYITSHFGDITGPHDTTAHKGNPSHIGFAHVSRILDIAGTDAGARYALFIVQAIGAGLSDPYVFVVEPQFGKLAPGQITIPPYSHGPADPSATEGADVNGNVRDSAASNALVPRTNLLTNLGISDGFKGQKALATLDSIAFTDTVRLTGRPYSLQAWDANGRLYAERMRYNASGVIIDTREPQEAGSNKTETRISDGFKGQKFLATQDTADFATRVTGAGKPALNADTSINLFSRDTALHVIDSNNVTRLNSGWPQHDASVVSIQAYPALTVSAKFPNVGSEMLVGISDDILTSTDTALFLRNDYCWYRGPDNHIQPLYHSNSGVQTAPGPKEPCDNGAVYDVTCDGITVFFHKNGEVKQQTKLVDPNGRKWRLMVTGNGANSRAEQLQCKPFNDERSTRRFNQQDGRIADPLAFNTQALIGQPNATNLRPTYTDTGTNITIGLPSHVRKVAGRDGPINLDYGATSASWPYDAPWWAYYDDPNLTGNGAPVLNLTSDPSNLLFPGRYRVAQGRTPLSGGGGGTVDSGGGGGGEIIP